MTPRKRRFPGLPGLSLEAELHLELSLDYSRRAGLAMRDGERALYEQLKKWARERWDLYQTAKTPPPRADEDPDPSSGLGDTKGASPEFDAPFISETIN